MAEVLILAGESAWIQSRVLNADEICVHHASEKSPNTLVQIAFRPGRVPYDGGYGFANGIALAWVGDWRNRTQALEIEGISPGTIAEELIALWKKRGIDMQENVHGLMACVLWDESTGQLHAFRDKIGLIPMVYTMDPATRSIAISSDADWLLEASRLPRVVNRSRLTKFLLGKNDDRGRDDFIQGLNRIRPRECLSWSDQQLTTEYYWNPDTSYLPPSDDHPRQFRELLSEILDSLGDHPRVYEMSGGVDSPSLVALAVEKQCKEIGAPKVRTVSMIAPKHPATDEYEDIKELVEYLKVDAHYFSISEHWPLQDLDIFKGFIGSGPHFHPEEYYIRKYYQWIYQKHNDVDVISGSGADQLLLATRKDCVHCLLERGDFVELSLLLGNSQWHRTLLLTGLEFLGIKNELVKIKALFAIKGRNKQEVNMLWRFPVNWIRENRSVLAGNMPCYLPKNCGQSKLVKQQEWIWELAARGIYRTSKRTNTRVVFPYFDDRLWILLLRIPPFNIRYRDRHKGLLRASIDGILPTHIAWKSKVGGFDQVVEQGIAEEGKVKLKEIPLILEGLGFVDSIKFFLACSKYQERHAQGRKGSLKSFPLWSTIAAEFWAQQVQ